MVAVSGQKKKYSQHYIGAAADLYRRDKEHRSETDPNQWNHRGSKFMWECNRRGIRYQVVRTWKCDSQRQMWHREVALKKRRNHKQLCPVCRGWIEYPASNVLEIENHGKKHIEDSR